MKDFVFVSDFDGTLTKRDFYYIVIDRYLGEAGRELYARWRKGEMKDVEFLSIVFQSINKDESEIIEAIKTIELDTYAAPFVQHIKAAGGDFNILSAGASYYIKKVLQFHGIEAHVFSNIGEYYNRGIKMTADKESPFYSDFYGIDKYLVVKDLKNKYRKLYYAGDSEPDLKAAMAADIVFAKGSLIPLLKENKRSFIEFDNFKEIETYLITNGEIKG